MKIRICPATESELASAIINSVRQSQNYASSDGNRYISRTQTSLRAGSSGWVEQDINTLFKTGTYSFTIPVRGKTGDYKVVIAIEGFLDELNKFLSKEKFLPNVLQRALQRAMDVRKIKISCDCPDFRYRYARAQTLAGNKAGDPETRPSIKTNPNNQKGACKHITATLMNKAWIPQVATNLHTYIMTIYNRNRSLFDSVIRPALNGITDATMGNPPEKTQHTEEPSTEQINGAYKGSQQYDETQNLMLAVAAETGADVQPFVTPENTPEQILEISKAYKLGLPVEFIRKLTNPDYSPMTIEVLAQVRKTYGLDWTRYAHIHPSILHYLSKYYSQTKLTPKDFSDSVSLREVKERIKEILK